MPDRSDEEATLDEGSLGAGRLLRARGSLAGVMVICALVPSGLGCAAGSRSPAPDRAGDSAIPSGAQEVTISKHTDGDTLHVVAAQDGPALGAGVDTIVRLLEIDTPESVDPGSPVQCYAERASKRLAALLPLGARAWVSPDRDRLDQYGRTLLYVWTQDGTFVNLTLVLEGYAEAVLYPPNDRYINMMRRAERRARATGVGLWGACDYFGQTARSAHR